MDMVYLVHYLVYLVDKIVIDENCV
jgi:hypothetical protein